MTKVSIVIPYYQREAGILRKAIKSIYAQELPQDVTVSVVVVDDQSPVPPEPEFSGFEHPTISVDIVRRLNGGPAKARNTGLDAAAGSDVLAFLDSDDVWNPGHLATGLAAIDRGADFYFANNWYEGGIAWFDGLKCINAFLAASKADGGDIHTITGTDIMPFMLSDCLAHTSTVMFDYRRHETTRFDEDLAYAGEDYLFWLTLASEARLIAFSATPTVARGRGVDLYRSALDWDRPECIRRLFYALILHKKILDRFCVSPESKQVINAKLVKLRRGILYLLARNALIHGQANVWIIRQLARKDRQFWTELPFNAYVTFSTRLRGNFDFPVG